MKKSTGEYTIIHHYPTSEEDFLKHQAELIADILLQLEPNEIESIKNYLYTTDKKGNLTLRLDDEKEE